MTEPVIETAGLAKSYGRTTALRGLDLRVNGGEVLGFLGPNGAGKSTTIRLLLDLIRPTTGTVRVLGTSPTASGPRLRCRIGYLPGELHLPDRLTGDEVLTFMARQRGGVDRGRLATLVESLELDPSRQVRKLSRGNKQKIGLVAAFMHDPELLILDEPSSGLDPLLQQRFLTMVRRARDEGRTVFMSSHVLSEVEDVADRVAMLRAGRLMAVEDMTTLRERAPRHVEIRFAGPVPAADFAALDSVRDVSVRQERLRCTVHGSVDALVKAAARHTVVNLLSTEPDLEETFLAMYARDEEQGVRRAA